MSCNGLFAGSMGYPMLMRDKAPKTNECVCHATVQGCFVGFQPARLTWQLHLRSAQATDDVV